MIIDLEKSEAVANGHSSVCIAGAGAAGICLAVELAKSGINVTLLESGGLQDEAATQELYASEVTGLPHQGIHIGRFRVLGGTTTRWTGLIRELDASNFEVRPWIPNSGWPFSKEAIEPYYQRALELEGLASAIPDDQAVWKKINCPPPNFGEQLAPFFLRWCPEANFARLHGEELRKPGKITVYLHANVCEILLGDGQDAIAGLRCRTLGGRSEIFTADRYVFCLGGIESARLLLQPLAQARVAPWNVHGVVGRYFQDHIGTTLLEIKPRSRRQFHRWCDNVYRSGRRYLPGLKLPAEEQRRLECLAISASFAVQNAKTEAYNEFINFAGRMRRRKFQSGDLGAAFRYLPAAGLAVRKTLRYGLRGRGYNPSESGIFLRFHTEQSPNPESRIELATERDATGLFRSRLHWAVTELEIHTIQKYAQVVRDAFRRSDFAEVLAEPAIEAGGSELISRMEDTYHHMGATRMADSPERGVVDADLRLFGVRNGYVCGSSVFPTSGFANPTHTIIALAVRLAEHLASTGR